MKKQFVSILLISLVCVPLNADTIILEAEDTGWYSETGFHDPDNRNYFTGYAGANTGLEYRSFFVFDLSEIDAHVLSAELEIFIASNGYDSPDPTENLTIWDVDTDAASIIDGSGGVAAFEDFGSGVFYGETTVANDAGGEFVMIALNQDATNDINSTMSQIVFGGSLSTLDFNKNVTEAVFAHSAFSDVRLVVKTIALNNAEGETVIPDDMTVFRGFQISGTLADVFESDDSRVRFKPGLRINTAEAPVWLIFDAALPSDNPDRLEIVMESQAGQPGHTGTLEAWNWTRVAYDVVDVSVASFNQDTIVTVDLSSGISDYVEAGTGAVRTRVGWRKTAINAHPWEIRLDQMVWIVE